MTFPLFYVIIYYKVKGGKKMFKYDIEKSTYLLYHTLSNGQIIYIGFDFIELNRKTETEIFTGGIRK